MARHSGTWSKLWVTKTSVTRAANTCRSSQSLWPSKKWILSQFWVLNTSSYFLRDSAIRSGSNLMFCATSVRINLRASWSQSDPNPSKNFKVPHNFSRIRSKRQSSKSFDCLNNLWDFMLKENTLKRKLNCSNSKAKILCLTLSCKIKERNRSSIANFTKTQSSYLFFNKIARLKS